MGRRRACTRARGDPQPAGRPTAEEKPSDVVLAAQIKADAAKVNARGQRFGLVAIGLGIAAGLAAIACAMSSSGGKLAGAVSDGSEKLAGAEITIWHGNAHSVKHRLARK